MPRIMEKFELSNGKFLIKQYGKYLPDLCLIISKELIRVSEWGDESLPWNDGKSFPYDLNLGTKCISWMKGKFFTSKKGTLCFEITENGAHYLLSDSWGGAFNSYRGHKLETLPNVYFKRKSSNGGGIGIDYAIIEDGAKYVLNEEDI